MRTPAEAQGPGEHGSESAIMTAVQDFDGYTLAINAAYHAVLGWTRDELAAVPFWELVHPEDRDTTMEDRERLVLQGPGSLAGQRTRTLGKDGWYRTISWDLRADRDEQRIYLTGLETDGRKPSLITSKRQLVGSWDWDITHDSASWSEGMFEIYGLPPLGPHNLEVALRRIHEDDQALVAEEVRRALTTGEPYTATHRILRTDGAVRWLYSAGRSFTGKDGASERMCGITWDVTDSWPPLGPQG